MTDSKKVLCGAALLAGVLLATGCGKSTASANTNSKRGEGVPVLVAKVVQKDVPIDLQVIGNVEAYSTISVKAQVGGELTKMYFKEGDYVKSGESLYDIDPRPLQAQLNQAEAVLAQNMAQLRQAEANLARDIANQKYAQAQSERYEKLTAEGVISKEQNEQYRTNADAQAQAVGADRAAIESAKAAIAATKANIENVKVQLGYTSIRSPIEGRTGNVMVKQGNIVAPNTVDLVTINQVSPIYVTFSVPESQLQPIKRYMSNGKLPVMAAPQDDPGGMQTGELTFIDNSVDSTTGTIKLKGTFVNSDRKLWPGEFVRVTLRMTTKPHALVVPNQAVQTGQDGTFVYVVKEDKSVESRPVVTSARIDQELVIDSGLEAGETVVTEGQLRLAPGMKVMVREGRGGPGGPAGTRKGGSRPTPAT